MHEIFDFHIGLIDFDDFDIGFIDIDEERI